MTAVGRVMVATDRSSTAQRAVEWAATLASATEAELILVQVLLAGGPGDPPAAMADDMVEAARIELMQDAQRAAGGRGRARVVIGSDPARSLIDVAEEEDADVLVVGNVGMSGRKEFLLGNVPNRVSHNARCTIVIVNTAPAAQDAGDRRAGAKARPGGGDGMLFRRAVRIARVLTVAGLRQVGERGHGTQARDTAEAGRRIREALEELGPTFSKLGQILSTRPDLLPPAVIAELAALQEHVTPLGEAEVVAAMERELAVPWEDIFDSIDPEPLAAGTIAQVHRATLETGERVVVKVQRPDAEADINADLGLLELLAERFAARPRLSRLFDVPAMIEHLSTSLRRELDFRVEAGNVERMRAVLSSFDRLDVPIVYAEYSTARLLVMQEIPGVPVLEAPAGEARREAARQLLQAYYHQVMGEGFFHADPHPGNLKWWNDTIYLLDLGMVGEVEAELRHLLTLLLLAFNARDAAFLAEIVLTVASARSSSYVDRAAFQDAMAGLIATYRDRSLRDIQLAAVMQEVTAIASRHNVRIPATLTLIGKAFAQMQMVTAALDPDLDPFSAAQAFVLKSALTRAISHLDPQQVFYSLQKTQFRAEQILQGLEGIVGARPGSQLQVNFRGTERLEAAVTGGSRRISLGLGLAGSLVAASVAAASGRAPRWLPVLAGGVGAALAASLVVERDAPKNG